jgi:endonuclease/exonuclease/phosphatase family metal-dependent hydrolase
MATTVRIATFNLENFDDPGPSGQPSLAQRVALMRPQLERLRADVLCLQELNSQVLNGVRTFAALDQLIAGTAYAGMSRVSTTVAAGTAPFDVRNLLGAQSLSDHVTPPDRARHHRAARVPARDGHSRRCERHRHHLGTRPILHATLALPDASALHVLNLHLKSKIPTDIPGQHPSQFRWNSASDCFEGSFISAMKRLGQALETRILIDSLFDADANARIAVCGDFNADIDEVPMEAIRGDVENTGNPALVSRLMIPCERNIPASARFSLYHHGRPVMLDHILVSRPLLAYWQGSAAHNEILHDESVVFAVDTLFPASDHAAVIAEFLLP